MIDIFIPSYHRPDNLKTVQYFVKNNYDVSKLHVVVDDEADDIEEYKAQAKKIGFKLHVFNMAESIARFDYVHRPSVSRRSGGQARNMFYEIARKEKISFYLVMDDDTNTFQTRPFSVYIEISQIEDVIKVFDAIKEFMQRQKIGCFGLSQTGDLFMRTDTRLLRKKVMNTTFINSKFIYRGEKGVQDNDTSQFVGIMNEGYFTGSLISGIVLQQVASASAKGGLTDLYNELKLLNKSLVVPIQFPSCVFAEKQVMNGNRLHHKIRYRYLAPCLMKGKRSNIAWNTYPEDVPFTNEPKRPHARKKKKSEAD